MENSIIFVYTDGACSKNGYEDARAGIGIYFSENDPRNYSARVIGKQTNNTAELSAILQVKDILHSEIKDNKQIKIYSDSEYAIKCCTTYGEKLKKKGWKNGSKIIPNIELVKQTYEEFEKLTNVTFHYIKAHTGYHDCHSKGNEGADKLANRAIGVAHCPYSFKRENINNTTNKVYVDVPYSEKEDAKTYGAKWDPKRKKWYFIKS